MAIILNLTHSPLNATVQNYQIYRNSELIDTIEGTVESYEDETAQLNTYYIYRVDSVLEDGQTIPGSEQSFVDMLNTGPGPQDIICGDWTFGYFGTVPEEEVLTRSEFHNEVNITEMNLVGSVVMKYLKYAIRGKVIFIPDTPFYRGNGSNTITNSLQGLYNKGVLWNTDDVTVPNRPSSISVSTPVNQNRRFSKGAYQYKVATINNEAPVGYVSGSFPYTTWTGSIAALLFNKINVNLDSSRYKENKIRFISREDFSTVTDNFILPIAFDQAGSRYYITNTKGSSNTSTSTSTSLPMSPSYGWFPQLELVPT